ncbi:MAG: undecaprenyl-diphosphate phosphatase [Bacillota bacterium]
MSLFQAVFLGLIQGLTEFLPISSSGHLVLFQHFFKIKDNQMLFNVFLHLGTLIPIFIIFWIEIKEIILLKKNRRRETIYILLAVIPTGIIGILFEDFFESLFSNPLSTGFMLLITGMILFITEKYSSGNKEIENLKFWQPVVVGLAQSGAIIPGISRSGSTIAASLLQGLNRKSAARFSFLISIPVIGGAGILQLKDISASGLGSLNITLILAGVISAALSGFFAIKFLLKILKEGKLIYFSYYCWIIGIIVIISAGLSL